MHSVQQDFLDACRQRIRDYQRSQRHVSNFHPRTINHDGLLFPSLRNQSFQVTYIPPRPDKVPAPVFPQSVFINPEAWFHYLAPDDFETVRSAYMRRLRSGGKLDITFRLQTMQGETAWIRHVAEFVKDHHSDFVPQAQTFIDVSAEHRLLEEQRRREFELDLLYDLSQQIGQATSPRELMHLMLNHLDKALQHDVATALIVSDASIEIVSQTQGPIPLSVQHMMDERILDTFFKVQGNIEAHYHVQMSTRQSEAVNTLQQPIHMLESLFMVPVFVGKTHEIAGMLLVGSAGIDAFTENDIRMLYTMANQAALAIEHILARRSAEQKRLESVVRNLPDGVLLLDSNRKVMLANPIARVYLMQISGHRDAPLSYNLEALLRRLPLEDYTGETDWHELAIERNNNYKVFEIAYRAVPLSDTASGWEIVLRDISAHKLAGRELHRALLKERELVSLKSQFVMTVSHEFRTPLATIMLSNDLLQKYAGRIDDEKRAEYHDRILMAVKHMRHMLDDVSTINKVDTGQLGFNPETLNIGDFCERLIAEERDINQNGYTLHFVKSGNCNRVHMDPQLLQHILHNLLSNAFKYSPAGSAVHVSLECDEKYVRLSVTDEGIGIPPDDIQFLFDQFHRGRNVENIKGTGLGLAITRTCVDAHNGTIQVESKLGEGSTFIVTLPKYTLAR